jgi:hypothetical protein
MLNSTVQDAKVGLGDTSRRAKLSIGEMKLKLSLLAVLVVLLGLLARQHWLLRQANSQHRDLRETAEFQKQRLLSDQAARELATKYRDDWVRANPSEPASDWTRGTIKESDTLTNGSRVYTFEYEL